MSAPALRGPRDVPALRQWMVDEWKPSRGTFAHTAPLSILNSEQYQYVDKVGEALRIVAWNIGELERADLWYVDANMVDLIETSAHDLPPVTLHDELIPAAPVLCVFERPLQGLDADVDGSPVLVNAIMWARAELRAPMLHRLCITATLYSRLNFDDGLRANDLSRESVREFAIREVANQQRRADDTYVIHGDIWIPIGRSDWLMGDDWSAQLPGVNATKQKSIAEDRRWLATLWSLATQPSIVTISEHVPIRAERRRAQRAGLSEPTVRIVNLRRSVYDGAGAERTSSEVNGKRIYHVRWPVRGHWRQQPYGPGREYRRPQFIAPFVKGPEGAPLKRGAIVRVLR